MKYEKWLSYADMSIAIEKKGEKYHCSKFGENQQRKSTAKICESTVELKFFLLSFPSAPKKEILSLISRLEKN